MPSNILADVKEKKVEVYIPESILGELKWLSDFMNVSPTVALRQALATQAYIAKVTTRDKARIFVEKRGGEMFEATFSSIVDAAK